MICRCRTRSMPATMNSPFVDDAPVAKAQLIRSVIGKACATGLWTVNKRTIHRTGPCVHSVSGSALLCHTMLSRRAVIIKKGAQPDLGGPDSPLEGSR